MHDPQVFVGQHHRVMFGACVISVDFCVAGEMMPCKIHSLFVQRIRDSCIHLAVHGKFNDFAHIPESRVPGSRADLADSEIFRFEQPHVKNINSTRLIKPSPGSATGWMRQSAPTILQALSKMAASPTTRGLQLSYTLGSCSAFTVISGPTPAGSPIVIPKILRISVPFNTNRCRGRLLRWHVVPQPCGR